mgnify:CR=1 FL=1
MRLPRIRRLLSLFKPGLHVGFVAQGWEPDVGGIESHTHDLTRELCSRGHRVSALALDYTGRVEPYGISIENRPRARVTRMSYAYHDHDHLGMVVRNREAERVFNDWIKRERPDVVHIHHLTGFGVGVLACARAHGVPVVMTLHDYWPLCPRGQMITVDGDLCEGLDPVRCGTCLSTCFSHLFPGTGGKALGPFDGLDASGEPTNKPEVLDLTDIDDVNAFLCGRRTGFAIDRLLEADQLVTPSQRTAEIYGKVCAASGLEVSAIEVVENGIDVGGLAKEVRRIRQRLRAGHVGYARSEVKLGVVGSVLPSKGVLELAKAFAEAKAESRIGKLSLHIHGNLPPYHGDSSYVQELRALARSTPGVNIHGPFEHGGLAEVLADLDGVAAPSRWEEVYGLTVREARAAGLPVIVSNAGDLPAVTAGGQAGLVVDRNDPRAWKDALEHFATDPRSRAVWASHDVKPRTARDMSVQLEKTYRRVIQRHGSA